jgi:hypothetical protein
MSDSNLEELLRSPCEDGSDGDPDVMPWKFPVAAAILGALVMAIYVIFAIVTGPTEETESAAATVVGSEPVEATGFPSGYAAVTDDVALRADVMRTGSDGTTLFVSSVVKGGTDPASVAPVEVADWTVKSTGSEFTMVRQSAAQDLLSGVSVELGPVLDPDNATLIATLPGAVESADEQVTLPPDLPVVLSDYEIHPGDYVVVIEELVIGDGWGSMRWRLEGAIAAKVDVVVNFDGLEIPMYLAPSYAEPPLWGRSGEFQFVRDGQPVSAQKAPTGITVEFFVFVVTEAGESVEIPIGTVVGP